MWINGLMDVARNLLLLAMNGFFGMTEAAELKTQVETIRIFAATRRVGYEY
jgi:hypothetical protein